MGPARARPAGYTLVAMVVIFAVMTVLVLAALPSWSRLVQRQKEEELIFRGLQYAEAIRVFQLRFGRYPVRLEELIKVNPRSIRQLWSDPMTEEGNWGLVFAQAAPGRQRRGQAAIQPGVAPQQPEVGRRRRRRARRRQTVAPLIGVHSLSSEKAIKRFLGAEQYSQWRFTVNLLPAAAVVPGTLNLPRVNSRWIGRPFPEGLDPMEGSAPGDLQLQQQPQQNPRRRRPGRRRRGG
ncbi:MAG: type II secretion system protein [Thermoanaerobaculia bacterium]